MNKNSLITKCKNFYLRMPSLLSNDEKASIKRDFDYFLSKPLCDNELLVYQILAAFFLSIDRFDEVISRIKNAGLLHDANYHLVIIIAYFEDIILGGVQDDTYNRLKELHTIDNYKRCIIEVVKGWYWQKNMEDKKYENALKKAYSIDRSIPQVWIALGIYHIENSNPESGKKLIETGLAKIKNVIPDSQNVMRELDPDIFIDSFIKAFYVHQSFYDYITRMIK